MATNLQQIAHFLSSDSINYRVGDTALELAITTQHYVNPVGGQYIIVAIRTDEDGEYFQMFCPQAFVVEADHSEAFLKACTMIQWRTKLVQFEYDEADGEVRPMVEFPIEDSMLTKRQLMRSLHGLVGLVDTYYEVLKNASETGEIDFGQTRQSVKAEPDVDAILDGLSEDQLLAALIRKQKAEQ